MSHQTRGLSNSGGVAVRELHERLPTLLQTPLPSDILSPQITLHLFPSTHPHLPTVSGRIAYAAALWTAPVAWGRVPLVGNVKLTILSERMVKSGCRSNSGEEKLIVKWKTRGKGGHRDTSGGVYRDKLIGSSDPEDRIRKFLRSSIKDVPEQQDQLTDEDFCGIFIFDFDENGRIQKHVIEHTEHGGYEDKTNKFVNVTDWLLGKFNGATTGGMPVLAYCEQTESFRSRSPR
ncbi:hypothetical protein AMS68_002219 [Peltaster fructicola]|uniref:Uncharacterized protein n=1 Tax=Peltaster fructicola TaxID=286661 RepID=A0A6H0XPL1_9PEZI|nr:hypothetical protein AMS68_002219 [Peltaster fructicola]